MWLGDVCQPAFSILHLDAFSVYVEIDLIVSGHRYVDSDYSVGNAFSAIPVLCDLSSRGEVVYPVIEFVTLESV